MKPTYNIHIGEYYTSKTPAIISTILGPCVAVCLYDKTKKIGGMNHILMPGDAPDRDNIIDSRYGINAMEILINQMMKLGANRYKLTAKVFGGAAILSSISGESNMGIRNVESVIEFLEIEKIPIINYNFGGFDSRRIYYHSDTDEVLIKRIKSREVLTENSEAKERRQEAEKRIKKTPSVIFFD
ncbi:MAG: chemotaxis protein CheD [Spirochaetae bacterium HGW-Spirochaetae-5]|nr:MAG: chemotaxis protein CheD [Spirochaetae bacterium HGW-Spirochaetae-5]